MSGLMIESFIHCIWNHWTYIRTEIENNYTKDLLVALNYYRVATLWMGLHLDKLNVWFKIHKFTIYDYKYMAADYNIIYLRRNCIFEAFGRQEEHGIANLLYHDLK